MPCANKVLRGLICVFILFMIAFFAYFFKKDYPEVLHSRYIPAVMTVRSIEVIPRCSATYSFFYYYYYFYCCDCGCGCCWYCCCRCCCHCRCSFHRCCHYHQSTTHILILILILIFNVVIVVITIANTINFMKSIIFFFNRCMHLPHAIYALWFSFDVFWELYNSKHA
ncbi:hypothetical protein KP509_07G053100 [Ceratopteris richardii]|uniref:Uncharacterized protein n=1 Tax=Ceratopteris richardii TaxID=49495 RepID=A0A8T2UL80_CERRI|nr:hypothetical protein KP509_07G053100 [Ceratopteris richardii]